MKILVTGGRGYVSRNIADKLRNVGHCVLSPFRQELDMTKLDDVKRYFDIHQPDAVVHSASTGGYRDKSDTHDVLVANVSMFETLKQVITPNVPVVFYTSGADFDRRTSIHEVVESDVINRWPIDPYGLAKNLIVRRILQEHIKNIHILRIFAAFNHDEIDARFITRSILNVKAGIPITIHQNREMDFLYMDDLFTVTDHLLSHVHGHQKHINMSYKTKVTLKDVATLICKYTSQLNPTIVVENDTIGPSYSGFGTKLENLQLPMVGLEEGIERTVNKLI